MGLLINAKHERYAQERAKGVGPTNAYLLAGYSPSAKKQYGKIEKRPEVQRRIGELIAQRYDIEEEATKAALARANVTKYDIIMELRHIAMTRPNHIFDFDADGNTTLNMDRLNEHPEYWTAIKDIIVEEYPMGRGDNMQIGKRVRVVLHDKQSALKALSAMHGMATPASVNVGVGVKIVMNEDELRS